VLYDLPINGSFTPTVDAINSYFYSSQSSNSITGPAMTLSGTDDAVAEMAFCFNGAVKDVTAVNGSWGTTHFDTSETGQGTALQNNVTAVTAPVWTSTGCSGGQAVVQAIAVGFNVITPVPWGIIDASGCGPTGTTITTTCMTAGIFGLPSQGTANSPSNFAWGSSTGLSQCTSSNTAVHPISHAIRFLYSGATYVPSQLGITCPSAASPTISLQFYVPGFQATASNPTLYVGNAATIVTDLWTNIPNTTPFPGDDIDTASMAGSSVYINNNLGGDPLSIHPESIPGGGAALNSNFSSSAWIYNSQTMYQSGSGNQFAGYDAAGNIIYNVSQGISSCTNANPMVCTLFSSAPLSGPPLQVKMAGFTGGWASANGIYTPTNLSTSTFSIPVNSTSFGSYSGQSATESNSFYQGPSAAGPATNGFLGFIRANVGPSGGYVINQYISVLCWTAETSCPNLGTIPQTLVPLSISPGTQINQGVTLSRGATVSQ
jgi:hypothetical protein